jgi:hypothetical protein
MTPSFSPPTRRFVTDPKKLLAARVSAPKNSSAQLQQKLSAGIAARKERGFSMTN